MPSRTATANTSYRLISCTFPSWNSMNWLWTLIEISVPPSGSASLTPALRSALRSRQCGSSKLRIEVQPRTAWIATASTGTAQRARVGTSNAAAPAAARNRALGSA